MKHFVKGTICLALALIMMASIAVPCFAETAGSTSGLEEAQLPDAGFNEYDYIVEMRSKSNKELTDMGFSEDEIKKLRSDSVEKELVARKELPDDVLTDVYCYTEDEIEILRNYDGGRLEDHPELRASAATVSFSKPVINGKSTSQIKMKLTWNWSKKPADTFTDAVAIAWCPTFAPDGGKLRLTKEKSLHTIKYWDGKLNHADCASFCDVNLNALVKSEFPMNHPDGNRFGWAKSGELILTFDKVSGSMGGIASADFAFSYGHSAMQLDSVTVELSGSVGTSGPEVGGSIGVTYGIGTETAGFNSCYVNVNPFVDVEPDDYFYKPVMWALDQGYASGTDATHFSPNQVIMRCDAMVFLWAVEGHPEPKTKKSPFQDVKSNAWYYKAVLWGYENGYAKGTDATHFSPKQECSRSEILQFLYAYKGKKSEINNPYKDVKMKHWYYDSAIWAYEKGLEHGENGYFNAKTPCYRADVVTYLYRLITRKDLAK